jgi:hypothetical protein
MLKPMKPVLKLFLSRISRFNIFTIGFLIFLAVFAYWVIPNLITFLGKTGIETLSQYKLFFISCLIFLGLVVWVIYLRYRLAVKSIESRTDIEKQRIQLEMSARAQIEYHPEEDRRSPKGPRDTKIGAKPPGGKRKRKK